MWNERYSEPGYAYGAEPNDHLREHWQQIPHGPVLSLAEGEGRNAVFLAQHGYDVLAVDGSEVGLQKARALAEQRGVQVRTQVLDLAHLDLEPDMFTGIVSIWAHVIPDTRKHVHRQVLHALRPGGVFLFEAYSSKQVGMGTGGPRTTERTCDLADVQAELDGLEFLRAEELQRDVQEGRFHNGLSWVTQLLARMPT